MTTQSWNTPISHTSDATFRLWGSELSARLDALGFIKTADTGQVDWVTVTRPGTNTVAGYEIRYLNDSLHGTAPIVARIEYGTLGNTQSGMVRMTVGTGSNGSGTITGQQTTANINCSRSMGMSDAVTNRVSYGCMVNGLVWVATKYGAGGTDIAHCAFKIERWCDATGAPTGDGFNFYGAPNSTLVNSPNVQSVRTASVARTFAVNIDGRFSFMVHGLSDSVNGSDTQAYLHWHPRPKVSPDWGSCSMLQSEASFGVSFSTTLVGTSPRTYLSTGRSFGGWVGESGATNSSMCLVYE